ncbi:hypothetical protein DND90_21685 [Pseudomonas syringae pv. maculicola]|nr:hypothetical protein DND90_21685 [Pseudomonas syringae pv. maculicola]
MESSRCRCKFRFWGDTSWSRGGAAAALAALIYGYSQGSKESDEYNKSLILTGNYAGTSAYQLADLAKQVSATNGTIGEAAASLAKMASSGAIASASFKVIADAAASMEDATGKSVDSTIAEFVKIAKDPVAAAKTLNEQYHFLTASVYSQITALKEQGDTIGAAKLLTDTYAKTIEDRAGQISLNLGLIEKGWKGIKDAAKGALDATLGIGRQETLGDQISALETKLANPGSYASIPIIGADNPDMMEVGNTKSQDEERLRVLKLYNQEQVLTTKLTGERQRAQEASILSQDKLNASLKATDSNQKKLKDRLKEIDDLAKKSSEAQGGRVYTNAELEQLRDAARKQFKDPAASSKAVDLTAFNDAQNQLKSITGYYDGIQKELDASQKAGLVSAESYASQRSAIIEQQKGDVTAAYESEIAALEAAKGKVSTSAEQRIQLDQKISDARTSMVEAQKKADSELSVLAIGETGRLKKQTASLKSYTDALDLQTSSLARAGQRAALGVGRGDRENAFSSELNAQDDRYANSSRELANQRGEAGLRGASKADLDAEFGPKEAALAAQNEAATKQIQQNYQDLTAAQGDWRNGASSAFKNYLGVSQGRCRTDQKPVHKRLRQHGCLSGELCYLGEVFVR